MKKLISFQTRDLVLIGLFAGAAKVFSLAVALMGGGMNPVALILKNMVNTVFILTLLIKVKTPGTLTLANIIAALLGLFLLGQSMIALPFLVLSCLVGELFMLCVSKILPRIAAVGVAIAISELLSKSASIFMAYLGMRENSALIIPVVIIVAIGYLGVLAGIAGGVRMVGELRHAGIIQN